MFKVGGPNDQPAWLNQKHQLDLVSANSFGFRLFGLHKWHAWGDTPRAILFKNCNSIHTFCLRQAIDVVFLDDKFKIISLYINVGKNKIIIKQKCKHIIELPNNYCLSDYWHDNVMAALQRNQISVY